MVNSLFQLNYAQMISGANQLREAGETITQLHFATLQRIQALRKEWEGEAAEKFFDEMDKVIPATKRLAQALFLTQDAINGIVNIIRRADEETANYFRNHLDGDDEPVVRDHRQGDAGGGVTVTSSDGESEELSDNAPSSEDRPVVRDHRQGDAGGGGSEELPDNAPSSEDPFDSDDVGAGGDDGSSKDDFGQENSSQGGGGGSGKSEKETELESESSPGGGGGGDSSSSESQGIQGDLNNMGIGLSGQASQVAYAGNESSAASAPDHIYSSGGSPEPVENETQSVANRGNAQPSPDDKSGSLAAGMTGVAAAVAGAAAARKAAKIIKEQQEGRD